MRELRGGRSMMEVARATGINDGELSRIERGIMLPAEKHVPALEREYGCPLAEMFELAPGGWLAVTLEDAA